VKKRKDRQLSLTDRLYIFASKVLGSEVGRKLKKFIESSPVYVRVREELKDFKERRLKERVLSNPLPHHVAIIMDGNRRYAKNLGLSEEEAYIRGKEKVEDVLEWCLELGIKILTVYAFSTENFKRSKKELDILFRLFRQAMEDTCHDERIHKNGVRVNVMGKLELLPKDVRDAAEKLMEKTKNYRNYVLNIALAYGGRQEIVDAIREIARKVREGKIDPEDVDERTVSSHLYTKDVPDPDLILRTSGEERISNFLLWQLAYSELYFADVYWPAFKKEDFLRAILTYQQRKRRFGR